MTPEVRDSAGEAWAFRARVEHDAEARFRRLAGAISAFDPDSPAVALMRRAAEDERRHARLCEELAAVYGRPKETAPPLATEIAPSELGPREAVLYEVVAACCITETESVATVTTLLAEDAEPAVRAALHEIARDEVIHGKMGWAHLAREAKRIDVSFLAAWVPVMLTGTVDDSLFAAVSPGPDDAELLRHGVFPQSRKREVFVRTLLDVVFPGLETFGISAGPARQWLEERERAAVQAQ